MTMLRRTQGGLQSQPDSQSMAEDACRTLRQESKPDHRSAAASDEKRRAKVKAVLLLTFIFRKKTGCIGANRDRGKER
jgi:hypothetical protein